MIHEKHNVHLWVSDEKKKLLKVSYVTNDVNLQKKTCLLMMKTHYDSPKSVSFEVQSSMESSYETMS